MLSRMIIGLLFKNGPFLYINPIHGHILIGNTSMPISMGVLKNAKKEIRCITVVKGVHLAHVYIN